MHITAEQALQQLNASGKLFIELFQHGSLSVEMYKPKEKDLQQPHSRDEIYVIVSGSGDFYNNGSTVHFSAGDFLFVAAGKEHRFLNFSEDLSAWVFFYGPDGGE